MINIGLEPVIDKAVQGNSVSFKVKLYDENLEPVVAEDDIVVTLSTSLTDIEESSFLEIPTTLTIASGLSEVLVTVNSIYGTVLNTGELEVVITEASGSTLEYAINITTIILSIYTKEVIINVGVVNTVKEGELALVEFNSIDTNGDLVTLDSDVIVELAYTYPQDNYALITEMSTIIIPSSGSHVLSIQTLYTNYTGSEKSVSISIVGVSSTGNSEFLSIGNDTSTITATGEVVLGIEESISSIYEGGELEYTLTLLDRLQNPVISSEDITIHLYYLYNTATYLDIVPIDSFIAPKGDSRFTIKVKTTKNVYKEGTKTFSIGISSAIGLEQFNNFYISDTSILFSIEDEVEDYNPSNPLSKDVTLVSIKRNSINSIGYGESIGCILELSDGNSPVISKDNVYIPVNKKFYKDSILVFEETQQVIIKPGTSYTEALLGSVPSSGAVANKLSIGVNSDISSMLGIEQFEQVMVDSSEIGLDIQEPEVEYLPEFVMSSSNALSGANLVYSVQLNENDISAVYSLIRDNNSTAVLGVDYTTVVCTNGVNYLSTTNEVDIPAGVSEFDIEVSTIKNTVVGKEDKNLILVLDGTVSSSATIYNAISNVISVSSSQGSEGSTITHEVVFADIDSETKAVGTLTNINAREGDIISVSLYYMSGANKVYVSSEVDGNSFYFNVPSTNMYVEIGTRADGIYESNKTYELTVGIVRKDSDNYSKTGVGTIINTTPTPDVTSISSTSVTEGSTAVLTVNLSTVSSNNITKPISFGGTAQANIDYNKEFVYSNGVVNNSGMLVIPPYVSSFTISVETYNDDLFKNSIYLDVNVGTKSGKITITNEEDRPTLTITNSQVIEGNYGVLTLGVTKASSTDTAVDLEFDVLGQTASIIDYVDNIEVLVEGVWVDAVKTGSRYIVTIPALDTDTEIRILTVSDNIIKGDKNLKIKANIQGVLPAITGTINIVDKDTAVVDVEDATVNETEGVVRVPIRMSKPNANSVSLNVVTEDVTADSNDYVGINTIVKFPAGSTEQFVDIVIRQDSIYEGPETFNVIIKSVSNNSVIIGKGVGVVTILDDDLVPNVANLSSTTISEGSTATHTVSLTNGSKFPTEVDILLTNHGSNISSVSTVVNGVESTVVNPYVTNKITLSPGLVNFSIKVKTSKDGAYRGNTSYIVSANIEGTIVSGVGTVTDENDRPKISISSASAREGDNLVFYVYLDKNTLVDTIMPYRLEHITTSPADIGEETFTRGVSYDDATGNITIPKGVRAFEVIIPTMGDTNKENLETLRILIDGTIGIGNIASVIEDKEDENIDGDSNAIVTTNVVEIDTHGFEDIEIKNSNLMVTGIDSNYDVKVENLDDLDITVAKKEYTITGDDIYIPQFYDDAPQWMKDLVNLVVDVSMSTNNMTLINDMNRMLQEFAVSYVPLNRYTQSILDLGNEDMRLNALIETLNSNFNNGLSEANAQIISLQMTKASKGEVVAQVIQTLSAQLADPNSNLGATVGRLDQAIVAEQTARATSFRTLTATLEGMDDEIAANAQVVEHALAYVGIDEAGASTNTGLSAYLEASDGTIGGADSQLANTIRVTAEGVESKWAYNSIVNVNGVYRKSGFGLTTNNFSGNGTQANPYNSEFWIDATKLRFTNSSMTGRSAPFTIDASGTVPVVKFNGLVEFSNVSNMPSINKTYVQTIQPTSGMNKGDTWIDTDDQNSLHTYTGSSWIKTDNGVKTYLQTNPPTIGMLAGDLWVDSDDNYKQYRYNGTSWQAYAFDAAYAINTNTTTINGSKITTGSITAAQINVNDLFSKNIIFTGTITGGNTSGGGIIQSYDGKMRIDLVKGSLHIK